ncbi:MAG TPA: condensation domain-containing protein, partial [Acidimicrobiales bacterium]|nr:condensation domain-containing protein [Acidimicrobiales bacterium]
FAEVVDRLRRVSLEAYDHAEAPFDRVVERLAPPRDLSRNPVFQVAFELAEWGAAPDRLGERVGLRAVPELGLSTARLDAELFLSERADGSVEGHLVYAADLFEPSTMAALAGAYRRLLAGAVGDPDAPVARLAAPPAPGARA